MEKRAPTAGRIAIIAAFALSCFGLALYLWISFGGPTPLRPESYRIQVPFDEATQLADQADVRISGVSVGTVSEIELPPDGSQAMATLSIDARFAPLPADVRATLRAKTLLGETYVELTPGTAGGPTLAEGATLPEPQVASTVQLDEILRALDAPTRRAFQTWMRDSAVAIDDRGQSLGNSFALFPDTFAGFERVFRTLDTQRQAVRGLFSNGAITFEALSERRGQLQSLIRSSNEVLATTARRDRDLIETFRVFPTFLDESRQTLARLREFSIEADPLMRQLTPVAEELSPTLIEFGRLAPELEGLFDGLRPVIDNAPEAFPAFRRLFRDDFPPLLRALDPFLRNVNPLLEGVRAYRGDLTALLGNAAAATNAQTTGTKARILRTMSVLGPDTLATFAERLNVNRTNAYAKPLAYSKLAQGLESFDVRQCSTGLTATLDTSAALDSAFNARTGGDVDDAQDLFDRLEEFAFGNSADSTSIPAPGCSKQAPFAPLGASGDPTDYQHTLEQAP